MEQGGIKRERALQLLQALFL